MNMAKKIGPGALFGIILGIFFVVLLINVAELISIINARAKALTDLEVEFLNSRMISTCKRILQAILTISVIVVIATTPILPFLEERTPGFARHFRLEGELFGSSIVLGGALLILIAILPANLLKAIVNKEVKNFVFSESCRIFIFFAFILRFLGDHPTYDKVLIGINILFCLKLISQSILEVFSVKTAFKELIVPNTESLDALTQEFTKSIGSNRKFDNIYSIDKARSLAFAHGIFGLNNIYVHPIVEKLSKEILFGVLSHEAGHCYHGHRTKKFFIEMFLFLVLLAIAGWFILKSEFAERLINGDLLFSRNQGDKLKKPSIAMKLAVFMLTIYPAFQQVSEISLNILHRHDETQADEFVVGIGHGKGLYSYFETFRFPHARSNSKIYSILYESHPHFDERMSHVQNTMENPELLNSKSVFSYILETVQSSISAIKTRCHLLYVNSLNGRSFEQAEYA